MSDLLKYRDVYEQSITQPDVFWGKAAEAIQWTKRWDKVLDDSSKPSYQWFAGGEEGAVVIKLPLPPGCLPTLWKDDKRYLEYVTERSGKQSCHLKRWFE